jgi:hypothetical protein
MLSAVHLAENLVHSDRNHKIVMSEVVIINVDDLDKLVV